MPPYKYLQRLVWANVPSAFICLLPKDCKGRKYFRVR